METPFTTRQAGFGARNPFVRPRGGRGGGGASPQEVIALLSGLQAWIDPEDDEVLFQEMTTPTTPSVVDGVVRHVVNKGAAAVGIRCTDNSRLARLREEGGRRFLQTNYASGTTFTRLTTNTLFVGSTNLRVSAEQAWTFGIAVRRAETQRNAGNFFANWAPWAGWRMLNLSAGNTGNFVANVRGAGTTYTGVISHETWNVILLRWNGSQLVARVNGDPSVISSLGSGVEDGWDNIGWFSNNDTQAPSFDGDIGQSFICDEAIGNESLDAVEVSLLSYYGVGS